MRRGQHAAAAAAAAGLALQVQITVQGGILTLDRSVPPLTETADTIILLYKNAIYDPYVWTFSLFFLPVIYYKYEPVSI